MDDKRDNQPPIPDNIKQYLNDAQLVTIGQMESFGWELFFIRRPLFQETLTIMYFPSSGETAVIEQDGTFNKAHDVYVRPAATA
jgi:hypothetical protein